jgi:glycerophosphoryl diester phosphodiesterase
MKKRFLLHVVLTLLITSCGAQTKIIAHRGFSEIAPENTLFSFRKAIDTGADYIEFDVHKTKNDSLVVIHDGNVKRTSSENIDAKVADMNYRELSEIKVGYPAKFGDKYPDAGIPTLREVLKLARGKVKVCIEIKVYGIEKEVLNMIDEYKMRNDVIIFSFHYPVLAMIRQLDKKIPVLLLMNTVDQTTIDYAKIINCNAIGAGYGTKITKNLIDLTHKNHIELWKWTVNKEEEMKELFDLKIDGIITNKPDVALKLRK